MSPTPGPPYEWDEDKRHHNIGLHGVDFTLADRANWAAATHRRSDRQGELRYSSYVPVDDRVHTRVCSLDSQRPLHPHHQLQKGQHKGNGTL